jgi:hypothetical protein
MGRKKLPDYELSESVIKAFKKALIDSNSNMRKFCEENDIRYGSFRVSVSRTGKMQKTHADLIAKFLGLESQIDKHENRTHREIVELVKRNIPGDPGKYAKLYSMLTNTNYIYLAVQHVKGNYNGLTDYFIDNCTIDSKTIETVFDNERNTNIILVVAPKNSENNQKIVSCYNTYLNTKPN